MINIPAITACFKNLIGFDQNTNTDYPTLSADLLISESGLKVQGLHPLLTIENIQNCSSVQPSKLSDHLKSRIQSSITKLINNVYAQKQLNETGKELINEVRLYDGTGNFNDKIVKQGRFVGFRIDVKQNDLSLIMRQIGLQFDTINDKLNIYIYHTSQSDPVKKIELNYDKKSSFIWKEIEKLNLPYVNGGGYIVGYYEDDIIGQAISHQQIFTRMPACSSCNQVNFGHFQKWFKYLRVQPFYVRGSDLIDDKTKWEENSEVYVDNTNFGLNLNFGIVCDMTPLFCRNREIFSHALSLQIACEFLSDMAYSTRDNQTQQKLMSMAMYALGNKEDNGPDGMLKQLEKAVKALDFNTSDINQICLPCANNAQRLTVRTAY